MRNPLDQQQLKPSGCPNSYFDAGRRAAAEPNLAIARQRWLEVTADDLQTCMFESGLAVELAQSIKNIPLVLRTSNRRKLAEFRRFGLALNAESGADLAEVDGTPEEVVKYKALAAGPGVLVEDTSLDVEGYSAGVNIRWLLDTMMAKMRAEPGLPAPRAVWRVMMAVHYQGRMFVAGAAVEGRLIAERRGEGFSFDCYFIPQGQTLTLGELDLLGKKDDVSARRSAVTNLLNGHCAFQATSELAPWLGAYQESN